MFLHIPKCGGQLIITFLRTFKKGYIPAGSHLTHDQHIGKSNPYTVVRNPYDWYVSRWNYYQLHKKRKLFKNMTFEDHIRLLHKIDCDAIVKEKYEDNMEYVWKCRTMKDWLKFLSCDRIVPIFKMEEMPVTLRLIASQEGIDITDEQIEKFCEQKINHHPHDHYSTYYNDRTKEIVENLDGEIIEKFGYEF